jgi:hypothetical protein
MELRKIEILVGTTSMRTVSEGPGMTSEQVSAEETAERNLAAVDAHFHSELQQDIDTAIDLYGDIIVWEAPARGVLLRGKAAVRQAYIDLFQSLHFHSITPVRRLVAGNVVVDDSFGAIKLVGDVEKNVPNCPFPAGTEVSLRVVHIFEFDEDGRIIRESAYELWRKADAALADDVPADAQTIRFD